MAYLQRSNWMDIGEPPRFALFRQNAEVRPPARPCKTVSYTEPSGAGPVGCNKLFELI
jgi:hypothetical protein